MVTTSSEKEHRRKIRRIVNMSIMDVICSFGGTKSREFLRFLPSAMAMPLSDLSRYDHIGKQLGVV
jgi:hypothetical protein